MTEDERRARETKRQLNNLTGTVEAFLRLLDAEMRAPVTPERGARVADLANKLDLANQMAKRFGLSPAKRAPRKAGKIEQAVY